MCNDRLIFYDTETTGVNVENDRIIELAAFDPVHDKSFSSLIKIDIPIPEEASRIHGISNDMLIDAQPFGIVFKEFVKFCGDGAILVAHNNDYFDAPILKKEASRHNIENPFNKFIDTLKWSRKYRPDLPKHGLQYLRQIYSIEENRAHRALDDVIVLYQICKIMFGDLKPQTIFDKIYGEKEELPLVMTFGKYQGKAFKDIPESYLTWLYDNGALDKPENSKLREAIDKSRLIKT